MIQRTRLRLISFSITRPESSQIVPSRPGPLEKKKLGMEGPPVWVPKDIVWLLMTEYFHINDALRCLSASRVFWCGKTPEFIRRELIRLNLCRLQRAHFDIKLRELNERINEKPNDRNCQYCGLLYRRNNTRHNPAECKELYIPKAEPVCRWCGCEYPTWRGSPHYNKWGRYRCALKPVTCRLYGMVDLPCFPNVNNL
jgi:hypothetical protein